MIPNSLHWRALHHLLTTDKHWPWVEVLPIGRGKPKYPKKSMGRCHVLYHKAQMKYDRTKPGTLRWNASDNRLNLDTALVKRVFCQYLNATILYKCGIKHLDSPWPVHFSRCLFQNYPVTGGKSFVTQSTKRQYKQKQPYSSWVLTLCYLPTDLTFSQKLRLTFVLIYIATPGTFRTDWNSQDCRTQAVIKDLQIIKAAEIKKK